MCVGGVGRRGHKLKETEKDIKKKTIKIAVFDLKGSCLGWGEPSSSPRHSGVE